ncbi:hypothetical protein CAEBREN_26400 [Caenorhabditis brenneri]|uniref:L-Fucosyltransferase n=1 Tax=Caenorhabditis brenneri TaxID=135651 RepID=G0NT05_CAEBE|nr:hypothetical protein CAEBREN_26400 [Caenorhabditis brenneri]
MIERNIYVDIYKIDKKKKSFDGVHYAVRIVKSPIFWMVFILILLLFEYWRNQVDPMAYVPFLSSHAPSQPLFFRIPYPPALIEFSTSQKYLSSNFQAFNRLGNHLFEVVSIFSLAKKLKRTPLFLIQDCYHEKMLEDLKTIVPDLIAQFAVVNGSVPNSIKPTVFHEKCCTFQDPSILEDIQDEYLYLNGTHYQSWKYFPGMRDDLINFLKEPDHNFLSLPESSDTNFIKCVHIRRGDFIEFLIPIADKTFIINAMKFIDEKGRSAGQAAQYLPIQKFPEGRTRINSYTVFFGDDFQFMEEIRNSTVKEDGFVSRMSPADDLLYSKNNCDVVLITAAHSTFGWWMGYLSKGNRVYHTDILYTDDINIREGLLEPSDYFLPHWIPLKSSGLAVVESRK